MINGLLISEGDERGGGCAAATIMYDGFIASDVEERAWLIVMHSRGFVITCTYTNVLICVCKAQTSFRSMSVEHCYEAVPSSIGTSPSPGSAADPAADSKTAARNVVRSVTTEP